MVKQSYLTPEELVGIVDHRETVVLLIRNLLSFDEIAELVGVPKVF